MDDHIKWLDRLIDALADARAMLACFGVDNVALGKAIDAALVEAYALKQHASLP